MRELNIDTQYQNLITDILTNGHSRNDRTGTGTIGSFVKHLTFDLRDGLPALNTKQVGTKWALLETLWMFQLGESDTSFLDEHNVSIWDEWKVGSLDYTNVVFIPKRVMELNYPLLPESIKPKLPDSWKTDENYVLANLLINIIKECYEDPHSNKQVHSDWHVLERFIRDVQCLPNYNEFRKNPDDYVLSLEYYQSNVYSINTCIFLRRDDHIRYKGGRETYVPVINTELNSLSLFIKPEDYSYSQFKKELPENHKVFKNLNNPKGGFRYKIKYTVGNVYGSYIRGKGDNQVDQIAYVDNLLKTDITSRRICMSTWEPKGIPDSSKSFAENVENGKGVLAPCHSSFIQFYVEAKPAIDIQVELAELGVSKEEIDEITFRQAEAKYGIKLLVLNAFTYQRSVDVGYKSKAHVKLH